MTKIRILTPLCLIMTVLIAGSGCAGSDGNDGLNPLLELSKEAAGKNCKSGGQRVDEGVDANSDGVLDSDEIETTSYLCNGADGTEGMDGSNGTDGTNGTDGDNGTDGLSALVKVAFEAPGANCANGGQRIDMGIDDNGNGTLGSGEIDSTKYVCDGTDGTDGTSSLVNVVPELPGANCTTGGQRIDYGVDADDDSVLQGSEVDGTSYICNGSGWAGATVASFSGEQGPDMAGWVQCEGYLDVADVEDIPDTGWADGCKGVWTNEIRIACGEDLNNYRYVDVSKNVLRDGLAVSPEPGLITDARDQDGVAFTTQSNVIYANVITDPDSDTSWWGGSNGCTDTINDMSVNNTCTTWEVTPCFGQVFAASRYLWVYVR